MSQLRLLRTALALLALTLLTACAAMGDDGRDGLQISQDPRGVAITSKDSNMFLPGSATLQPEAAPFFDRVGQLLRDRPERKALIDSVSDNTGSAEYNQELQEVRALSMMKALTTRGVDRSRLAYVTGSAAAPTPGSMQPVNTAAQQSKIIILGASTADMNVNTIERFFNGISNLGKSLFN
ncbi:OmpA family protein [Advenella sp. S44]|uniref:OmpA family protein n=1 Tax=Advenella sp. S44 TaxID=1982755 RepID=UPI00137471E5|nr:OmpA family protein [Advenella sp. S44]